MSLLEGIYTPTLFRNSSGVSIGKQKKVYDNMIRNNKKEINYKIGNEKIFKKSLFNKIKNNVLISNIYNINNDLDKLYIKNSFKERTNINYNNINKSNKQIELNDKNTKSINQVKRNMVKSQHLFKFHIPRKENTEELKKKFYRYSNSNMTNSNNSNNNIRYKDNNIAIRDNKFFVKKSNRIPSKNRLAYSSKANAKNLIDKDKIEKITKKYQNYLNSRKSGTNTNLTCNINLNKINTKTIYNKKNYILKETSPRNTIEKYSKKNISKKRPLSTNYRFRIINKKIANNLSDLLDINEKNLANNLNEQITKYVIGKTLGKGSYAIVKLCTDKLTNENYAMKIYNKSELKDKVRKRCVNNEIETLKRISHENIIKLIEVIELKEYILIVQELFQGISLSQYYKKNWKSEDLSKEKEKAYRIILKQIFNAINYLHKNNIAHLDIKLDNILINKNLDIKIIDFGFAIYDPNKSLNNFFGGTPNYMSPEIVLKRPYVSILSDIWSLGILIFKLFCNDYPFKGFTEKDLYNSIKKGKFRIKCYVNYDVKKLINSMIVLDPNKRLSCEQLLKNPWFNGK